MSKQKEPQRLLPGKHSFFCHLMDIKAELSPKIIKKGDPFMVQLAVTNDTETQIKLKK
jgi:hypothetical protein